VRGPANRISIKTPSGARAPPRSSNHEDPVRCKADSRQKSFAGMSRNQTAGIRQGTIFYTYHVTADPVGPLSADAQKSLSHGRPKSSKAAGTLQLAQRMQLGKEGWIGRARRAIAAPRSGFCSASMRDACARRRDLQETFPTDSTLERAREASRLPRWNGIRPTRAGVLLAPDGPFFQARGF